MPVIKARRSGIGLITLDNPKALNAWDTAMQQDVTNTVRQFDADDEVQAVVITGAGERAFCSGQDLDEISRFGSSDVAGWLDNFKQLYDAILSAKKPVIAAVNGIAVGSGYQLALVCDVRVAHGGVRLGQPEVSSGIPSVTGQFLTAQSLGHSRTVELMLSGRLMDAAEAHQVGLIHALVAPTEVLDAACEYGRELARQPKLAFQLTKRRIRDQMWPGLLECFEVALEIDEQAWASGEPQETARQFFSDRGARTSKGAPAVN